MVRCRTGQEGSRRGSTDKLGRCGDSRGHRSAVELRELRGQLEKIDSVTMRGLSSRIPVTVRKGP
jgi:hypothetical protein